MRDEQESMDCVAAVHRINERWFVHRSLRVHALEYMAHLTASDPERLVKSCRIAMGLVHERRYLEDPKPLLYAGLFSLATVEEAEKYLNEHLLTGAVCRSLRGDEVEEEIPGAGNELVADVAERLGGVVVEELGGVGWECRVISDQCRVVGGLGHGVCDALYWADLSDVRGIVADSRRAA